MVLAQKTPLLLLDEPTTFLDIAHQIELMELFGIDSVVIAPTIKGGPLAVPYKSSSSGAALSRISGRRGTTERACPRAREELGDTLGA